MIKRFFSHLLVFLSASPIFAQTPPQVNPINVALKIIEDPDTAEMAATCRYYKLTEAPAEGEFKVFNSPDGAEIRFTMTPDGPSVEVSTRQKLKQIISQLEASGFSQPDKSDLLIEDATRQITINKKTSTLHIKKKSFKKYDR